jgi:radical SAM superfamily enzyme YgiQ (UPF0313 family)
MKVKLIVPAVTGTSSPFFRPIKYSLFPPLGMATLAAYVRDDDDVTLQDEYVEALDLDDRPDLVAIQVAISSANRVYEIADHYRSHGTHVALGGLHVTSLPDEALQHADSVFLGPGEDTWPRFLDDFRRGCPGRVYQSTDRTLVGQPPIRRDLIKRNLYLAPNSLVVTRGCPHSCDFCYKDSFFRGGKSFYTQSVDQSLSEIERLPGRHLYFLDDNLFGNRAFALELFEGLRGMNRVWQAAGTVQSALTPRFLEKAVESGLRSLFVGFETLSAGNLQQQHKRQNNIDDYEAAIRRLHDLGVMINASFVFGMDDDDSSVFDRTVEWAVANGIETATFHILTPYPGTPLHARLRDSGRILTHDWDLYDTRHVVFQPAKLSPQELEDGYWRAYREFYRWSSIFSSARTKPALREQVRHFAYTAAWRKCEPLWKLVINAKRVSSLAPALEAVLDGLASHRPSASGRGAGVGRVMVGGAVGGR